MVDFNGLFAKAKRAVRENPTAVSGGLDKVEGLINEKTKGKYADKVQQGRGNIDKVLGVPGRTREAYRDEAERQQQPGPVGTDPIDAPAHIDEPAPIDDLTAERRRADGQPGA